MIIPATIAATGLFSVCLGLTYYLVKRPHTERLLAGEMEWNEKEVECPVCTHVTEIVAPPQLTEIECGNCGRVIQLDAEMEE